MNILPVRTTARLFVLDPEDRLLLIRYRASRDVDAAQPGLRLFWFTPGGGLEPGEMPTEAARRELLEETGIDAPIGPLVARRQGTLTLFRRHVRADEHYFLVRSQTAVLDTTQLQATEGDPVEDVRWWPLDQLAATTDLVEPRDLIPLARALAGGVMPRAPLWLAPATADL